MQDLVASVKISDEQPEIDLRLLEQLYQWDTIRAGNQLGDIHAEFAIQEVRDELVKNIARQILDSDLFIPNAVLQRFLDQRDGGT